MKWMNEKWNYKKGKGSGCEECWWNEIQEIGKFWEQSRNPQLCPQRILLYDEILALE